MKRNRYLGIAMMAAGVLAATSCTDFSDFNDAPVDQTSSGNKTLWENISQDGQLSDFATLLKRVKYDAELAKSSSYTVWAPTNGTFDLASYSALTDSALLQSFVKNHIALYSHVASGSIDERVHTLNNKSYSFTGNGSYTFDGIKVTTPNQPSTNGVMHVIEGAAQFYPNINEYFSLGKDIDSIRNYFKKYEVSELDLKNSVKGPVIGGIQTYIDSVVITSNKIADEIRTQMTNEDSTYTFLMPNNKAYRDLYNKIKPLYNFIEKTTVPDVEKYSSYSSNDTKSVTVDAAYLSDSITRRLIVNNLSFSNNDYYNQWLVGKSTFADTLHSTTGNKFSNPNAILGYTKEKVKMSNGMVHVVDSLAYHPWEAYSPVIEVNPAFYAYTDESAKKFLFSSDQRTLADTLAQQLFGDKTITRYQYLRIYPTDDYSKPYVFLQLPGVQSRTYKFYCVFMPYSYGSQVFGSANENKPHLLNFQLRYCAANGNVANYNFSSKFLTSGKASDENPKTVSKATAFMNDTLKAKADTVYIGEFTFPVTYSGLGDFTPIMHISNPIGVFNKKDMAAYTRDVRIAAILMKPVELVEFEEKQK